ncbi:pyridoxine-5'-phosphate oxidase-like isoform X2 [Patiria miniata]|uniref:pyridoxal 5'-phosphate synthase n=1 Tax=Patiria miniata TaxID=46514 RepID=A0A913YYQ0_PATMI|nr:pyridoxine-5'-phosphate oxidase-like isoform X2 [Patiria miniata]
MIAADCQLCGSFFSCFRAAHLSKNLRSALRKCVSTSLRSTSLHSRFYSLFSEEDDNMSGIISSTNGIDVAAMRKPYKEGHESFEEGDLVAKKPMAQFAAWFKDATELKSVGEPNAMTVATASKEGRPSARILLMKGYDEKGFKFFTNYESRKGQELRENPYVALCWYWEPLSRSVRVEGRVERLSEDESTEYFHSRPPASQIGAVVSNQSRVIENRAVLTSKDEALKEKYLNTGVTIPKPNYWGGFRVIPEVVEFWQGQSNRLHDRIVFRRPKQDEVIDNKLVYQGEDGWVYERLSP